MRASILPLGLGTAAIGRPQYINIRQSPSAEFSLATFRRKGLQVLEDAYRQGIRYFDTAPGYGLAEELLIEWLVEKNDTTIELATKWGYTYVANFDANAKQHEVKEHSLAKLQEQWKQSKRLLPFLTSYQIHSATFETGVLNNEEVLHQLAELKDQYDLHIGITSTGANQAEVISKALEVEVEGISLFDVFQVTYNLFDQNLATLLKQVSTANKRVVIKEALANGRVFPNEKYPHYAQAYTTLGALAAKYGVGLDAIALRFCIDTIDVYKVLSGAVNKIHLSDNLKAVSFKLAPEDIETLKGMAVDTEQYWQERKRLTWN